MLLAKGAGAMLMRCVQCTIDQPGWLPSDQSRYLSHNWDFDLETVMTDLEHLLVTELALEQMPGEWQS